MLKYPFMLLSRDNSLIMENSESGLMFWKLTKADILNFTRFVYQVYRSVYKEKWDSEMDELDLVEMIEEDLDYYNKMECIFIVVTNRDKKILGTQKISKKGDAILPSEKILGFRLEDYFMNQNIKIHDIWHVGRLAIDKDFLQDYGFEKSVSVTIYKKLRDFVICCITSHTNNIGACEMDYLALKVANKFGYKWRQIGDPVFYLGSNTHILYTTAQDYADFAIENKSRLQEILLHSLINTNFRFIHRVIPAKKTILKRKKRTPGSSNINTR